MSTFARAALAALILTACGKGDAPAPVPPPMAPSDPPALAAARAPSAPPRAVPDAPAVAPAPSERVAAPSPPPPSTPPPPARGAAATRASLEDEAERFAALLTADSDSAVAGAMARARPGGDLADLAEQIDHGGAVVRAGGIHGDLGPGGVGTAADPVATPPGRIALAGGRAADATSLDVDEVKRKVMGVYMAGIKRCYKGALKTDPTLRGQLALGFTVNEFGRAVAPTARGLSDDVDTCVAAQLRTWRFPVPKDDDGEPTSAAFTLELQLAPG